MRLLLLPSAVCPDVVLPAGAAVATPRYGVPEPVASFGALAALLDTNSGAADGEAFVTVRRGPTRVAVKVRVVDHGGHAARLRRAYRRYGGAWGSR